MKWYLKLSEPLFNFKVYLSFIFKQVSFCFTKIFWLLKHYKQYLQKCFFTFMFCLIEHKFVKIVSIIFIIFSRSKKLNIRIIKIISHFLSTFVILWGFLFNGFKCLVWHHRKHLLLLFLILISHFLNVLLHQATQYMYFLIMDYKQIH